MTSAGNIGIDLNAVAEHAAEPGRLEEERETGPVSWQVYTDYVRATGSWIWIIVSASFLIMTQIVNVANSLFLGYWSGDDFGLDQGMYMIVYAGESGIWHGDPSTDG
jgi:hypothetical protein